MLPLAALLLRLAVLLLPLAAGTADAAEVLAATVTRAGGGLTMHAQIRVHVPATRVRALLTDYERLPRVNGGLRTVQVLVHEAPDTVRMRVASNVCILFVCLEFRWWQRVRAPPGGDIEAEIVPGSGDFREGRARWTLLPEGETTRLTLELHLVPDFWFPPLIGPWLIERKLRQEALDTAVGLERAAAEA